MKSLSQETMNLLQSYHWPCNIRELEHEIERAITLIDKGQKIETELLSENIRKEILMPSVDFDNERKTLKDIIANFERSIIKKQLDRCNGNVTRLAQILGLTRQGLFKKRVKYDIKRAL